ncbi:hypothetical protein BJD99_09060 [Rhodococcus sp. 1163]|nr:hypothetical protein BJD99_09060 [Rhodococcus sp. 1163]
MRSTSHLRVPNGSRHKFHLRHGLPVHSRHEAIALAGNIAVRLESGSTDRFNVSLLHAKAGRFNNRIEAKAERSCAGAVHPTIEPIGNLSKG